MSMGGGSHPFSPAPAPAHLLLSLTPPLPSRAQMSALQAHWCVPLPMPTSWSLSVLICKMGTVNLALSAPLGHREKSMANSAMSSTGLRGHSWGLPHGLTIPSAQTSRVREQCSPQDRIFKSRFLKGGDVPPGGRGIF